MAWRNIINKVGLFQILRKMSSYERKQSEKNMTRQTK